MHIKYYIIGIFAAFAFALAPSFAADTVVLKVGKDGSVYRVEEKKITLQELGSLAAVEAKKDKDVSFHIVAEADVSIETMTGVMDACRKAGANRFNLSEVNENRGPNQPVQTTPTAATPPAGQPPRQP